MRRAIMNTMGPLLFVKDYIIWHYGRAVRDFFDIARDLLWFGYHFFSLPVLTRTLFAPFSRIHTEGFSILAIESSLQNIALNLISRIVGLVMRLIVIAAGIVCEILLAAALIIIFLVWLILPWTILFLLAFSAKLIA